VCGRNGTVAKDNDIQHRGTPQASSRATTESTRTAFDRLTLVPAGEITCA
jgi:hypothetical protein